MSFDLGKLFTEWRRIVPNGVPNPGNAYHLVLLKEICLAKGIDKKVVDNVILALEQDETFTARKKDSGKVVAFGSEEARDDAIDSGDYEEVDKKDDKDGEEDKVDKSQKVTGQEFQDAQNAVVSNTDDDIDSKDDSEDKSTSKEDL